MEGKKKQRRTGVIRLRVSEAEMQVIQEHLKGSTHRSLSEYLRRVALNKPVTIRVRNASADDFLSEVILLRETLDRTCNTYARAVAKLQELRTLPQLNGWLLLHESSKASLMEQVRNIESLTLKLYEQWLQE